MISGGLVACTEPDDAAADAIGGVVILEGSPALCAGAPALIEREVRRLEAELGGPFAEPVHVVVEDVAQACADAALPVDIGVGAAGCALSPDRVATDLGYLSHELVHAHRLQHGVEGTPFFEEGFATVLGDRRPVGVVEVERPTAATAGDVVRAATLSYSEYTADDLALGKHFVAWLASDVRAGTGGVALARYDETTLDAEVVAAYGDTLDNLAQRWEEQSAEAYLFSDLCAEDIELGGEGVQREGMVACDDPQTVALKGSVLQDSGTCFRVSEPAEVQIELAADVGELLLRPLDCPGTNRVVVVAGELLAIDLPACQWSAMFSSNAGAANFSYSITRTST